jgi:hypothetical protein
MNSDFFDRLNNWIRNTESSIVNFLSSFAPWLAPIIPAYMTYSHATGVLEFPFAVAVPAALVVEILGFSAVSTFLAFWFYNRRTVAGTKRAPIEVVIIAFVFYLALIVVSNVLLDATKGTEWSGWAVVAVRALYTLQTIPAALIVAVRTQHRELLSELAKEKLMKVSNSHPTTSGTTSETTSRTPRSFITTSRSTSRTGRPSVHQERVFSYLEEAYFKTQLVPTFTDVMNDLQLSQSTASRLRNEWITNKQVDSESNQIGEN